MKDYQYLIEPKCYEVIYSFYHNVALKYRHTYSEELMHQNIDNAVDAFFQGYHMANTDKWYYAYMIVGDIIIVTDACHAQNMHD